MTKYRLYSRKQGWLTDEFPSMRVYTSSIIEGTFDIYHNKTGQYIEECISRKKNTNNEEKILLEEAKIYNNWYLYPDKTNIGQYTLL